MKAHGATRVEGAGSLLVGMTAGGLVFLLLAVLMASGSTLAWDEAALRALRQPDQSPIGPRWLHELARDLTALGSYFVLMLLVGAVLGFLLLERKLRATLFVAAASLGAVGLSLAFKSFFGRGRPEADLHLTLVHTSSFPSGHAMVSASVYLTLGMLLMTFAKTRTVKIYFLALALALTGLIGTSRVYLGVHYPTDVLAGWSAGLAWAAAMSLVAGRLQERGTIEEGLQ